MNKFNYIFSVLLLVVTQNALARDNFYLGGGIGVSNLTPEDPVTGHLERKHSLAWQLFLGKDFGENFGVEASYTDLGVYEFSKTNSFLLNSSLRYKATSVSGLVYWPSNSNELSLYGKVGLNYLTADFKDVDGKVDHNISLATGIGLRWNVSKNWFVRGEYNLYDEDYSGVFIQASYLWGNNESGSHLATDYQEQSRNSIIAISDENKGVQISLASVVAENGLEQNKKMIDDKCINDFHLEEPIYFEVNSAVLSSKSKLKLIDIANEFNRFAFCKVDIRGWADTKGSNEYNKVLSRERAKSVKHYLVEQGFDEMAINVIARGESYMAEISKEEKRRAEVTFY